MRVHAVLIWSMTMLGGRAALAAGQTAVSNGDVQFPARIAYKNPNAILQHYDAMMNTTSLHLGIASANPLALLLRPIVQLDFETTFNGNEPRSAPDSILMTSRVFRLQVAKRAPGAAQPALMQQAQPLSPGAAGPMLNLVASSAQGDSAIAPSAWRAAVGSVVTGSNPIVTVDDTGIWFHGQRWLAIVVNVIDLGRKKGELPLNLVARSDTGRFSLARLPDRVRQLLREGLTITITEDVHRLAIPVSTLLQMTSSPAGVKARFGTVDFAIEGDEFNALQDFASRLAPVHGPVALAAAVAQSAPSPPAAMDSSPKTILPAVKAPDSSSVAGIAAGTEMGLASTARECSDSAKVGDQFRATLSQPIAGAGGFQLGAGTPVLLTVAAVHRGAAAADPIHLSIVSTSVSLAGRDYPLTGVVTKDVVTKEPGSPHHCIPVNGAMVLRLTKPFQAPQ